MALSKIEWTDYTLNHWNGCTAVAPECDNCYAEARDERFGKGTAKHWGPGAERQRHLPATRNAARRWNKEKWFQCTNCGHRGEAAPLGIDTTSVTKAHEIQICAECGENMLEPTRARVFAQSLSDTFDNEVPQEWRDELFALAEECTNLDFLFLTKRIGNVCKMVPARWLEPGGWPKHIRLGVTAGTQKAADRDIPQLLALNCPNFVSMEPLLERVVLRDEWLDRDWPNCDRGFKQGVDLEAGYCEYCYGHRDDRIHTAPVRVIEWVIVGGESGRVEGIRPMSIEWARWLRDQCEAAGVPFLFKQWGEWAPAGSHPAGTKGKWALLPLREVEATTWPATATKLNEYPRQYFAFGSLIMQRVGKDKAGRTLDGRTHDGFPKAAAA